MRSLIPNFVDFDDSSYCNRNHSSLITVLTSHHDYVEKQPVASKEYFTECCLKETPGKHGKVHWPLQFNLTLYSIDTHFNTSTTDCF